MLFVYMHNRLLVFRCTDRGILSSKLDFICFSLCVYMCVCKCVCLHVCKCESNMLLIKFSSHMDMLLMLDMNF